MKRLTEQAHDLCGQVVAAGDVVIDATVGNGHDTLFLARRVGNTGKVYGFDRQTEAIRETSRRLEQAGVAHAVLLHADHAEMRASIPPEHHGRVAAVMLNLGYLPGGDKSFVTETASTLPAIEQGLELLKSGGVLTALCYPGHPGGAAETAAVTRLLAGLADEEFEFKEYRAVASPAAPVLLAVWKR